MTAAKRAIALIAAALILSAAPAAEAVQILSGPTSPHVAAGTVIDDDAVIFGEEVIIDGTVKGDLFIFARRVALNGFVEGDLVVAGQTVEIMGRVSEDARLAAQHVRINGRVGRNLWAAGQDIAIGQGGEIGRNSSVLGQSLTLAGVIRGNLDGAMETLLVQGTIGGSGKIKASNIRLGPSGQIGGDLLYTSDRPAVIEPGGLVAGRTEQTAPPPGREKERRERQRGPAGIVWAGLAFVGGLIIWALWRRLLPDSWLAWQRAIGDAPVKSGLLGLLLIGGIPFVSLLLAVTFVGIPLAVITMLAYTVIYYLSQLVAGGLLGSWLCRRLGRPGTIWAFPLGFLVVSILLFIPVVGIITRVVIFALGLGGLTAGVGDRTRPAR